MIYSEGYFDKNWFAAIKNNEFGVVNIVCFPFGGGGVSSFWAWKNYLIKANIFVLKLPGRETKRFEPLINCSKKLANHIVDALPLSLKYPLIFYGHSMGAGLAHLTILELYKRNRLLPSLLIVSGREPPHIPYIYSVNNLNDKELIQHLKKLGGTPEKALENSIFMEEYLPRIRGDYTLNSSIPICEPFKLPIFISVINGQNDSFIRLNIINEWQFHTVHPLRLVSLPGDHFFINKYYDIFLSKVNENINDVIDSGSAPKL